MSKETEPVTPMAVRSNDELGAAKKISIHWERGMFWHNDCAKSSSGVMKAILVEEKRSVIECLHCGKKGYYPKGGVGSLCCDEVAPNEQK